ncbi:MAG: hypothetical protein ABFD97_11705 [Syntrophobacter sp.]
MRRIAIAFLILIVNPRSALAASTSIFPRIEFENPGSSSADRDLTDKGMQYLLPVQLAKACGPLE